MIVLWILYLVTLGPGAHAGLALHSLTKRGGGRVHPKDTIVTNCSASTRLAEAGAKSC